MNIIESPHNQIIKYINLLNSQKAAQQPFFIAEGVNFVSEITANWEIKYYIMSSNFYDNTENKKLYSKFDLSKTYLVPENLLKKICKTETPQGVLAVVKKRENKFEISYSANNLFILIERLSDPGNLGTIIRTAHAMNVDAVFLSKGSVDLYNPKVLRSTMGSIFHIPIFTSVDILNLVDDLAQNSVNCCAAHLKGVEYPFQINYKKSAAIIIGNEASGLSNELSAKCNLVKIPMPGKAESLNAAVACSMLIYEAVRQRMI